MLINIPHRETLLLILRSLAIYLHKLHPEPGPTAHVFCKQFMITSFQTFARCCLTKTKQIYQEYVLKTLQSKPTKLTLTTTATVNDVFSANQSL